LGFEQPAHGIEPVAAILSVLGEPHEMHGDVALGSPGLRSLRLRHALEQRGRNIKLAGNDLRGASGRAACQDDAEEGESDPVPDHFEYFR
jgi:hypothetical protein